MHDVVVAGFERVIESNVQQSERTVYQEGPTLHQDTVYAVSQSQCQVRSADAQVAMAFRRISRWSRCAWADGTSRCGTYVVMSQVQMACAAGDFAIALLFSSIGYVLENSSGRLCRCELSFLYVAATAAQGHSAREHRPGSKGRIYITCTHVCRVHLNARTHVPVDSALPSVMHQLTAPCRLATALHLVSLLLEFVMLALSAIHVLNVREQWDAPDREQPRARMLAVLAFSGCLSLVSFSFNVAGAQRLQHAARWSVAHVAAVSQRTHSRLQSLASRSRMFASTRFDSASASSASGLPRSVSSTYCAVDAGPFALRGSFRAPRCSLGVSRYSRRFVDKRANFSMGCNSSIRPHAATTSALRPSQSGGQKPEHSPLQPQRWHSCTAVDQVLACNVSEAALSLSRSLPQLSQFGEARAAAAGWHNNLSADSNAMSQCTGHVDAVSCRSHHLESVRESSEPCSAVYSDAAISASQTATGLVATSSLDSDTVQPGTFVSVVECDLPISADDVSSRTPF